MPSKVELLFIVLISALMSMFEEWSLTTFIFYFVIMLWIYRSIDIVRVVIWYRRLPQATLRVDGKEVEYRYLRIKGGRHTLFASVNTGRHYPNKFTVACLPSEDPFKVDVQLPIDLDDASTTPATLELEGVTHEFLMSRKEGRCPCSHPIPCWEGMFYFGVISTEGEQESWRGPVVFVDKSFGKKKKYPKKSRKKREWRLPALFPQPVPS